jgi:hypothetical protein
MMRLLVVVFFWICAVGVLALSIRAEIVDSRSPPPRPIDHSKVSSHSPSSSR